jgi:hypothetical protein
MSAGERKVPGGALLRVAERLLSRRMLDTAVRPALADLQHEAALARQAGRWRRTVVLLRGYAALGRAVALWLATWPARAAREDWLHTGAPGPRLLAALAPRALVIGVLAVAAFAAPSRHDGGWQALPFLVPSIATALAPAVFLLGLLLALGRLDGGGGRASLQRWLGSVVALSLAATAITFVSYTWLVPDANQTYRERMYRWALVDSPSPSAAAPVPAKGVRELRLGELSARLQAAPSDPRARLEWHKRWALPAGCLGFGLLSLAFHGFRRKRSTFVLLAAALSSAYLFYVVLWLGEWTAKAGGLAPVPAIWAADVLVVLVALGLVARLSSHEERTPA